MQQLLVLNLFISLMWPVLNNDYTFEALLLGFIFGFVVTSLVQRRYGQYTVRAAGFVAYVLLAILQSNLRLAATVLANAVGMQTSLRPGIVAVPLDLTNPFDITVLATVITLTPGTLSVDLGEDVSGRLRPYGEPEDGATGTDSARREQRAQSEMSSTQLPHRTTGPRARGEAALLVHAIDVSDPKVFRADIKQRFESPLLELRRLIAEMDSADN
ncbi:MAG: hypothetical protein F4X14_00795 [Caldilineaceae bacterium SB0661_bin_32]|uniref:Na+/H+ antiporter subunit E n=1 Tax=Caldilineaceae bacterium SB0661_bin_32 TaxID=2605255 RepID=A0A6B1D1Y1_9CHLR|nr:hypothetical protein [Caldilineaceae bacterium SB0661_bin_32]